MEYKFNRLELAGSFGDLGTLLPLSIGMIMINGLSPMGVFFTVGLFYALSGIYYRVTVPVQPMKVIGAYAIVSGISASQIMAAGVLVGIILLVIGGTGAITVIGRYIPKSVIRGVQLSTGALLMSRGVALIIGTSGFQEIHNKAEPFLIIQNIGPVSIGIIIGVAACALAFFLLENKRIPAGLAVVLFGLFVGIILGTREGFDTLTPGLNLPGFLPFGIPSSLDFATALFILVIPQMPMTIGNAVVANADLSEKYFGPDSKKVTYKALCISMGLANLLTAAFGGIPLCHGAGGLAAHYRFGARTAGSNLMIGGIFILLAIVLGKGALAIVYLIPMSVLGALLFFAGTQLALTITDIKKRKDMFVVMTILGITLASNLAVGFIIGIAAAYALKSERFQV